MIKKNLNRGKVCSLVTKRSRLYHEHIVSVSIHSTDFFLLRIPNAERPLVTALLVGQRAGLRTAMFPILEQGKHIPPHRDPYNGVLRFNLDPIVPEPRERLAIRVADRVCHWEEGRALIFDDHGALSPASA